VPWFVWLIIAAMALAGEVASTAFILVYVGAAAILTAVLAAVGLPTALQLAVFVPVTVALLTVVRPHTLARLGVPRQPMQLTGHSRLVDRQAVVEQDVSDDAGLVQLGAGEYWSARAYPPGTMIPKGSIVRVMFVQGLIVHVTIPTESGRLPELPTG